MGLLEQLAATGLKLSLNGEKLDYKYAGKISTEQLNYLKANKLVLMAELKKRQSVYDTFDGTPDYEDLDRNLLIEEGKRYAYHFELENNAGAGTWITDKPSGNARGDLAAFYGKKKIKTFELLN